MSNLSEVRRLRNMNKSAIVLHSLVLVFIVAYGTIKRQSLEKESNAVDKPYNCFLIADRLRYDAASDKVVQSVQTTSIELDMLLLVCLFVGVTIVAHIIHYARVSKIQATGTNYLRWIEYAVSASIMIVILLILSTGRQSYLVLAVFVMTFVEMFQGYFIEKNIMQRDMSSAYLHVFLGWVLFAAAWTPVIGYLYDAAGAGRNNMSEANDSPDSLEHLIWIIFIFFALFGVVNLVHVWKARKTHRQFQDASVYKNVMKTYFLKYIEPAYITLSFVSKTALVIWVASAVLISPLTWIKFPSELDA